MRRTMPTAPAKPDGSVFRVSSAKPWKWMLSWEGYSSPNATNQPMNVRMTMLKSVLLEKRCVARLYRTCTGVSCCESACNYMHSKVHIHFLLTAEFL